MEPEPILPAPRDVSPQAPVDRGEPQTSSRPVHESSLGNTEQIGAPALTSMPAPLAAPVTPQPVNAVIPTTQVNATDGTTDNPAIADDVEVIEKEWVDKAKKIVSATKDDPHTQEKEVSKLQADYLMKRYGKQIKLVD